MAKGFIAKKRMDCRRGQLPRLHLRYYECLLSDPCPYCGEYGSTTYDHVIPKADGGSSGVLNIVGCHDLCNRSKGSKGILNFLLALYD